MRIKKITPFLVDRFLLVRVYTDEGIVGNGEAGLWAHQKMVYQAILELSDYYIGKDPARIEHHYQVVSRDTHFMGAALSAAMSAIDVAMWDILGQSVNLPVYQLLGGKCRDKVKVFNNVTGNTLAERGESAVRNVEEGFISLRTTPFFSGWEQGTSTQAITTAIEIVKTIREAVGYEVDLGLEIHRNLTPDEAIILAGELAPFRILYYEDPLAPQSVEALDYVARHVHIPMATGERFYNIQQFKDLIDRKTVSLIRPDVSLAGGITQCKKIAALAEASFVGIFPHLMGSPVNLAAFVQLDAAIPNYVLMESHVGADAFSEIVDEPLKREGGYVLVPDRPGIGLQIDEAKLEKFPFQSRRITGSFRADGAVAH
ncbi:MAG: mandelate racemase/muconate lactonizing enzyme family protein [Candidatus Poribacteria bacterium]|nr:mandelate racemase/muconate lactonizing enzyme family protein [Candidatus Poribacteria bacterium]